MDDQLVFDASQKAPAWQFPAMGLLLVGVGVFTWGARNSPTFRRYYRGPFAKGCGPTLFAAFYLGFSLLWTTAASVGVFGEFLRVRRALGTEQVKVAEGPVENFQSGHDTERFTVGGVSFAYSDYTVTAGFNQSRSHGGPIHEGLQVRIHYLPDRGGNVIVRLAIKP